MNANASSTSPLNVALPAIPPDNAKEKLFRERVDLYYNRLVELSETMAGQILWRKKAARDVAMTRRDIYRRLSGWRNKAAFEKAWNRVAGLVLTEISVESSGWFFRKWVPIGVFGPLRPSSQGGGIVLCEKSEFDTARPLKLVPDDGLAG